MQSAYGNLQSKISSIESKVLDSSKKMLELDTDMNKLIENQQTITIQLNDKKIKLAEFTTINNKDIELLNKSRQSLETINISIKELADSI